VASTNVGILVRPIPDGALVSEGNDPVRLRLSLVLMPDAVDDNSPFIADLSKLPASIRSLTANLTLRTRFLKKGGGLTAPTKIAADQIRRAGFAHDAKWEKAAQKVWDTIFADIDQYGGFSKAIEVLQETQKEWDHLGVVEESGGARIPRLTVANLKPLEEAIRGIQASADLAFLLAHKRRNRSPWEVANRGSLDPAVFDSLHSRLFAVHRAAVPANDVRSVETISRADGLQRVFLALEEIASEADALAGAKSDDAVVLNQVRDLTKAVLDGRRPRLDENFMATARAQDNYLAEGAKGRFAAAETQFSALRASSIGTPGSLQKIAEARSEQRSMSGWWHQMMISKRSDPAPREDLGPEDLPGPRSEDIFEAMSELLAPQIFRDASDLREEFTFQEVKHSTSLSRALKVVQHEYAAFRVALRAGIVPDVLRGQKSGRVDEIRITDREKIQRKLAGIYAYPALARFLGLIVDVEIVADAVTAHPDFPEFGFISADLDDSRASPSATRTTNWVAYKRFGQSEVVNGHSRATAYFRPLPSDEMMDAMAATKKGSDTYRSIDGLLNLGQLLPDGKPRYELMSLDTAAAARSMELAGHHVATARAAGERQKDINTFFAARRTIGIALIDGSRGDEIAETLARAKDLKDQHDATSSARDILLFSEDLEIGYRLSIGRKIKYGTGKKWTFRSLHERELSIEQVPKEYVSKQLSAREAGYIRAGGRVVVKEVRPVTDFTQNEALLSQVLAVYRNWSLAIPVPDPEHPSDISCGEDDLPLTINIDMPRGDPRRLLPPVRYGDCCCAVAEIVFQNGSSIGHKEAHRLVQTSNHYQAALPAPDNGDWDHAEGFRFLRENPIGAPSIHLAEALHSPAKPDGNFGEQVRRMVVRSGKIGPKDGAVSRRFAIPPRSDVEAADLHGAFDKMSEMPEGALRRFKINRQGMLPTIAPDGKITFEESEKSDGKKHGLGTIVVVNKGSPIRTTEPFFPDPLAHRIIAMIDVPETGPGGDGLTSTASFYEIGNEEKFWPNAYPVLIELKPVHSIPGEKDFNLRVETRNHDGVLVNALIVELAPAREAQLALWCLPKDPAILKQLHAGAVDLNRAADPFLRAARVALSTQLKNFSPRNVSKRWEPLASIVDAAIDRFERTAEEIPIPSICHVESLTLLHAIQRPLQAPTIPAEPALDPAFGDLKFVRIVSHPEGSVSSWEKALSDVNGDLGKIADKFRGTVGYFGGHLDFDCRSTEWIECRGHWVEYDDSKGTLDFSPDSHSQLTIEGRADRSLFKVGPIPRLSSGGNRLDLLLNDDQTLRSLNYDFKDTKARRLSIDLIATSRFSEEFDQSSLANQKNTQGSVSAFQLKKNIVTDYWVRSTDHPKPPEILDDETTVSRLGVTEYGFDNDVGLPYAARTTRNYLHVRLARPWFSSGEGEMLGLVLWPPTILTEVPNLQTERSVLCEPTGTPIVTPGKDKNDAEWLLDTQLEPNISRWGADATRGTFRGMVAFPPMLISPDVIVNSDATLQPLRMPVPTPPPQSLSRSFTKDGFIQNPDFQYRNVAIAAFKVKPHIKTQTWYCDIGLHPHHDDETRVRLSLVRYQKHSLPGLELSTPVPKEVKLKPKRTLKVFLVDDRTIRVQVSGHSYDMKEVRAENDDVARFANVAYMAIELKQLFATHPIIDEDQPIAGPTTRFSATVTPQVYQFPSKPKIAPGEQQKNITKLLLSPRFDGATAFWESGNIVLEKAWNREQYVVLVREIELVASSATDPKAINNELELAGLAQRQPYAETLIVRRARPNE
jgi:hypothetical protein